MEKKSPWDSMSRLFLFTSDTTALELWENLNSVQQSLPFSQANLIGLHYQQVK